MLLGSLPATHLMFEILTLKGIIHEIGIMKDLILVYFDLLNLGVIIIIGIMQRRGVLGVGHFECAEFVLRVPE